jgi:uncharacterized oligopeptide transporter (OPT) family protein
MPWIIDELNKKETEEVAEERITLGVSLSSGLIAGGSIIGLIGIILVSLSSHLIKER